MTYQANNESSETTFARITKGFGDAKNLAEFITHINSWVALTRDLGLHFNLFRGQENESWRLLPGIARQKHLARSTEKGMLDEFKHRAIPYLESSVDLLDADWLAIAQHHAMPTRLLDWSGSALSALWFAVGRPPKAPDGEEPAAAVVWILSCKRTDLIGDAARRRPLSITDTKVLKPRHVSRRIAAQDGRFTVHRRDPAGTGRFNGFIPLDGQDAYKKRVSYIKIPPDALETVRRELVTAGITRAVLYPDLDGIAGTVTANYLYPHDDQPALPGGIREA